MDPRQRRGYLNEGHESGMEDSPWQEKGLVCLHFPFDVTVPPTDFSYVTLQLPFVYDFRAVSRNLPTYFFVLLLRTARYPPQAAASEGPLAYPAPFYLLPGETSRHEVTA